MIGDCLAGVGQVARARLERRTGMGARRAERARRAVQRGLEVTEKIVMLELGGREEKAVQQDAEQDEPAEPRAFSEEHLPPMMPRNGDERTRASLAPQLKPGPTCERLWKTQSAAR